MASYLSFLTSNSSSAPTQQQYSHAQPASSTWANSFATRIATLRKALTKDSEDDDPDNEDCSHVSNVLRAYYMQKDGRLPDWLPEDPKKPKPSSQMQAPYGQQGHYGQQGQYGNMYGNMYGNQYDQTAHNRGSSGGAGGLNDLWDPAPPPPAQRTAPQSLRSPRPTPQSLGSSGNSGRQTPNDNFRSQGGQQTLTARPLPSQRAGSFQNTQSAAAPVFSKADRIKGKLIATSSGRGSPVPNQSGQSDYSEPAYSSGQADDMDRAPYTSASQPWSSSGGYDNYTSSGSSGSYGNPVYRQRPGGPR